jgi:hypothetical protein
MLRKGQELKTTGWRRAAGSDRMILVKRRIEVYIRLTLSLYLLAIKSTSEWTNLVWSSVMFFEKIVWIFFFEKKVFYQKQFLLAMLLFSSFHFYVNEIRSDVIFSLAQGKGKGKYFVMAWLFCLPEASLCSFEQHYWLTK